MITADAIDPAVRALANRDLIIWGGVFVGVLLVGAAIIAWVDRWRKSTLKSDADAVDNLTAFRLSYEQGDLTEEEYQRIRARLAAGLKIPPKTDNTSKTTTP